MQTPARKHFAAALCAALLSACGGGTLPAPPTQDVAPPTAATLTVSTDSLALAVSGQARHFVITNVGGQDAVNLVVSVGTPLPPGSAFASGCTALAQGASCMLTVTPGAAPSAAPGDTAALPAGLSLAGSNTNTLALSVHVLDFGSVYQSGYVFDLDDSTPATGSVGGKVMALANAVAVEIQANNTPSPISATDGATNTANLVSTGGAPEFPSVTYAAWACDDSSDAGFTDWYLPAICEWGYDADNSGTGCGTASAPTRPNILSHLVDKGVSGGLVDGREYWSSTGTNGTTWYQRIGAAPLAVQRDAPSSGIGLVRCVRALGS